MANALHLTLHLNYWRRYMPVHLAHRLRVLGVTEPPGSTPPIDGYGSYRGHPTVIFADEREGNDGPCWRYASDGAPTPEYGNPAGVERPAAAPEPAPKQPRRRPRQAAPGA